MNEQKIINPIDPSRHSAKMAADRFPEQSPLGDAQRLAYLQAIKDVRTEPTEFGLAEFGAYQTAKINCEYLGTILAEQKTLRDLESICAVKQCKIEIYWQDETDYHLIIRYPVKYMESPYYSTTGKLEECILNAIEAIEKYFKH